MEAVNGKLMERIERIKRMCEKCKEEIHKNTYENDIRCVCYNAFIDHLEYFATVIPVILRSKNKKRWGGKLIKQTYISMLSTIEYVMKSVLRIYPRSPLYRKVVEYSKNNGGFEKISLTKIVQFSTDIGIFNRAMRREFENIIEVRHLLVHNNAISNSDEIKTIGTTRVELKKGKTLSIKITDMLEIITTAIELFHRWNLELAKNNGFIGKGR